MTRISIELVPRSVDQLQRELQAVAAHFQHVNTINIPDLLRFDLRSWQGCALARQTFPHAIPHIRAIDFSSEERWPLVEYLRAHQIDEVLVVTGDPPPAEKSLPNPATTVELIGRIKREMPEVTIYAAIDPYRNGIQQEIEYAQAKQAAGAAGFFTQPFFDIRLMEIFLEQLPAFNIYWGISPVLTKGTLNYWTSRNRAIFPATFEPTMYWNQQFGREALAFARKTATNVYFMPIRANIVEYLGGVFRQIDRQIVRTVAGVSF